MTLGCMMRPTQGLAFPVALALLAVVRPGYAGASPVSLNFAGTVSETNISGVNVGDSFSGTLSYDTSLVPEPPSDPSDPLPVKFYEVPAGSNLISVQLKVGSQTFGVDNPDSSSALVAHNYSAPGSAPPIDFLVVSQSDALSEKQISVAFNMLGPAFPSDDLPTVFDLSKLDPAQSGFAYYDSTQVDANTSSAVLKGSITSLTAATVPEPSTLAVCTLAIVGYGLARLNGRKSIA
jgi:hypothetical protein